MRTLGVFGGLRFSARRDGFAKPPDSGGRSQTVVFAIRSQTGGLSPHPFYVFATRPRYARAKNTHTAAVSAVSPHQKRGQLVIVPWVQGWRKNRA